MDDIQGKIKLAQDLRKLGKSEATIEQYLEEYDHMDEERQADLRDRAALGHLDGSVEIPEIDQQDNEANKRNAADILLGTYSQENSTAPKVLEEKKEAEWRGARATILGKPKVTI